MAIEWGPYSNHMRVGIDVWTDGYDSYTPSINVYVAVYVQCGPSWNFQDNQRVELSGSVGGAWDFYNNLGANQVRHIGTSTIYNQAQSYSGGPTYTLRGVLLGNYLGGTSEHTRYFTLPPRPTRPPAPPGGPPKFSRITGTTARLEWPITPDSGGATLREDRLQVSKNDSFTQIVWDHTQPGSLQDVTGLAPATRYYARAAVRSDAGWSGWSSTGSDVTASFQTAPPTVTEIGPDSARINWTAPDGAVPTRYEVQRALDSNFASGVQTVSSSTWDTTRVLSDLSPAVKYWVRVRSGTAAGWGSWSTGTLFETLSGAKIRLNGQWVDAVVWVRAGGQWKQAKVYKRVNGAWAL